MATSNSAAPPPSTGGASATRARVYTPRNILTGDPARHEGMSAALAQNWWALAVRGAAAILFGLVALFAPGATLLTLALFFAAYLFVDGVFGIVSAVRAAQRDERWGLLLAEGILNILMGVIVFLVPAGAVLAFVLFTAFWSLLTGGLMLAAAFRLKLDHGRWWMVLSGAVSILFGIALVIAPVIGAVVLTWWFGGYAIAFGAFLLVLAFRLRNQKGTGGASGTTGSVASQGA
jgi:uncharacterized membrane protein HdeD (DUF308 family)